MKMPESELTKQREILFAEFPPGQVAEAVLRLQRLESLQVEAKNSLALNVRYDLRSYNLRMLLDYLTDAGFHLDNSLMSIFLRALAHYTEEVQSHNLEMPERQIKKAHEAFVQAWEQHPHGDQDDTPPEWRNYK